MQNESRDWSSVSTRCVLLFLVCFGTVSSLECPHKCICPGTTVECTNQNLTFIPQPLPASITTLILTGNQLLNLTKESFPVRLDMLAELYLSGNLIEQVAPGVFHNLPGLRLLDLSHNKIINFSADAFSPNNKLEVLNLNSSLYNFSYVYVVSNLLKHSVPKLSNLSLANNGLVILPDDMFNNLSDLTSLDLSSNSIVSINNSNFRNQALHSLDLRDNSLKTLYNGTLLELNQISELRLHLGGNSWVCDCEIEDMVTWLKRSDVVDKLNVTCAEPLKLRNTKLLLLDPSKLQCASSGDAKGVLETSYVFLGLVLALIGVIFLLVLYLNRKGIKRWMYNIRDACRDHMEGYHYRYEINSDPRLANLSLNSDV